MNSNKYVIASIALSLVFFAGVSISYAIIEKGHGSQEALTIEQAERKAKVDKKWELAWQDIKKHNLAELDEQEYVKVDLRELPAFSHGELTDKKRNQDVLPLIREGLRQAPKGSTKPVILVKKDYSEVIFSYKEKSGKNVSKVSRKENSAWNTTTKAPE